MLKVALIGCGFMGRMHSEVYGVMSGVQLKYALDTSSSAAGKIADARGAKAVESFAEILGDPDLDIVDICLPTDLHAEYAVKALEAGKHVFCEKPMALAVPDARSMAQSARDAGRYLMIGHCIRFWPEYDYVKRLHDSRRLGRLQSLNLTRFGPFPSWSSNNWLADESRSGGAALDLHIHDTDYALYLLGLPDSVESKCVVDEKGPSYIFTTMSFGPTVVQLEGGWNLPSGVSFKMAFRAIFEKGAAFMDGGPLTIYEDGKDPVVPGFEKMSAAGTGGNISDLGGYYLELKDFVDAIVENRPLQVVTPESSIESLRICLSEIEKGKRSHSVGVGA